MPSLPASRRLARAVRIYWPFYLMVAPVLIYFTLFLFWPMLQGILISFQKFGLLGSQGFIGFENYQKVFTDRTIIQALTNTLLISAGITFFGTLLPIIPAIALAEVTPKSARLSFQTVIYTPYLLSWVIIIGIWMNTLSPIGLVNSILMQLDLIGRPIPFFSHPTYARPMVVGLTVWKDMGFIALIYYSALMSLNTDLIEAAELDGANGWHKIRDVLVPHLVPVIRVVFLITLLGSLRTFDSAFLMLNGRTASSIRTLAVFTYERGILRFDLGLASAAGVLLLALSITLAFLVRRLPGFRQQGL